MKKIAFVLLALAVQLASYGQTGSLIDLAGNTACQGVDISKDGIVKIAKLGSSLLINYPNDATKSNFSIQFNTDAKNKFIIYFDKTSGSSDTSITVTDNDLVNNQLILKFQAGYLVSIGDQTPHKGFTVYSKTVPADNPYIRIIKKGALKPAVSAATADIYDPLKFGNIAQKVLNPPFLSWVDSFTCPKAYCPSCLDCKGKPCGDTIPNRFNQVFLKACTDANAASNATSASYVIFYDRNRKPTLMKLTKGNKSEHLEIQKNLILDKGQLVDVFVEQDADSTKPDIEGNGNSEFTTAPAGLNDLFAGGAAGGAAAAPGAASPPAAPADQDKNALDRAALAAPRPFPDDLAAKSTEEKIQALAQKFNINLALKKEDLSNNKALKDNLDLFANRFINDWNALIASQQDLQQKLTASNNMVEDLRAALNKVDPQDLKAKMLALEYALEMFNAAYSNIDYRVPEYKQAFLCLQLKIKRQFRITLGTDLKTLAPALIAKVAKEVDSAYYDAFVAAIKDIQTQYEAAGAKTGRSLKIYSASIPVPNQDALDISITGGGATKTSEFTIRGGWKIDFSTGVFINGLASKNYILGTHAFRYKETKDFVLPNGTDSIGYTGAIKDTSGNLVQTNSSALSYSLGFLIHAYYRTGGNINWGPVVGFSVSNSAPALIMVGGSAMVKWGSSRLSISAGGCIGQQKILSREAVNFKWDRAKDPDFKVYNSIYDMPRFYTGSNDIPTFQRTKLSWFFGISFNFPSFNTSK